MSCYHDTGDLRTVAELEKLAPTEFKGFAALDGIVGREDGAIPRKYRELRRSPSRVRRSARIAWTFTRALRSEPARRAKRSPRRPSSRRRYARGGSDARRTHAEAVRQPLNDRSAIRKHRPRACRPDCGGAIAGLPRELLWLVHVVSEPLALLDHPCATRSSPASASASRCVVRSARAAGSFEANSSGLTPTIFGRQSGAARFGGRGGQGDVERRPASAPRRGPQAATVRLDD